MYLKVVDNPSDVNVEIPLLKDSRLGGRAGAVLGKKENF